VLCEIYYPIVIPFLEGSYSHCVFCTMENEMQIIYSWSVHAVLCFTTEETLIVKSCTVFYFEENSSVPSLLTVVLMCLVFDIPSIDHSCTKYSTFGLFPLPIKNTMNFHIFR
jgi:hypothetical protein